MNFKISFQIYGGFSDQSITILNNFASKCILRHRLNLNKKEFILYFRFQLALKYLEIGANRAIQVNNSAPLIVGYYCNYAEALFHSGNIKKAIEIVRKAELMAQSQEPRIKKHAEKFRREIEQDAKRKGVILDVDSERTSWRKWLPI